MGESLSQGARGQQSVKEKLRCVCETAPLVWHVARRRKRAATQIKSPSHQGIDP